MEKTLYYNGDIITMENNLYAKAVLVKDGIIEKVSFDEDISSLKSSDTKMINLDGKTMLPSFIDAHSHITAFATSLRYVSLAEAKNFDDIIKILTKFKNNHKLDNEQWIIGFGYDHNNLIEKIQPTKFVLDKVSLQNPILISHVSGHMGVVNSVALKMLNIDKDTLNPDGGIIGRIENSTEPNGYLEENAFMQATKSCPKLSTDEAVDLIQQAQQIYLSYGITTIQDGLMKEEEFNFLKTASQNNKLIADIVGYVDLKQSKSIVNNNKDYVKQYKNNFKIGGYKIFLDGSPQGRTAWISKPYENAENGYCGYSIYKTEQVVDFIRTALDQNIQLLAHCNGDAAAQQFIDAYKLALKDKNIDVRPVMIHAQLVRANQLNELKALNMIPSYFVAHTYYWGDTHIKNLGKDRAFHISPIKETIAKSIPFTLHQDSPVILPNMLETIWCAVNRVTKNNIVLGEDEKISVLEALKGITINAAYQYFEENKKGSIKEKKNADFVILDKNPLKVESMDIKNIQVLETIKNNISVFRK